MGNQISLRPSDATGKIVFCDGSVHEFDKPLTVAELMLEHPQQVVVEFHSAVNQKRPNPLPADKKLEMNNIYMMLPIKRGKPVGLSSEETRRILLIVNSALHSKYLVCSSRFLPWLTRLCQTTAIVEAEPRVAQKKEEGNEFSEFLPEFLEGRPEYLSRQLSGKGWKPNLDTIKEKNIERKLTHWLFLKNF
ncbi:uncharacterized protein LOC133285263 [Gastrolobium bilobum]|uniref:uncharacterized protein LOC133285263 n=1 Tax=Gastrolobium bilobum TaxID=150636 RepID=UPI002AB0DC0F|nr:uncharacterized protein LOC133285263 [Gastrolobium bilobum]